MDRTCVSTGPLRKPRSSSPDCTDPQRWRPSRRQPPPRTGCPSCTGLLRPAGPSRDGIANFFESGQRRRLRLEASRERTAMPAQLSAGQHRVHSCDRRKGLGGARRLGPGVRVPTREPALPTETARGQSTRGARVESSLLERGRIAAQLRPPGQG